MTQHLTKEHGLDASHAAERLDASHVGPNNQQGFWCGFCCRVIKLRKPLGVEAYDERFTHIDSHFIKENKSVEHWIDVEKHCTKSEMRMQAEKDRQEEEKMAMGLKASGTSGPAKRKRASVAESGEDAGPRKRRIDNGLRVWICVRLPQLQRKNTDAEITVPMWGGEQRLRKR